MRKIFGAHLYKILLSVSIFTLLVFTTFYYIFNAPKNIISKREVNDIVNCKEDNQCFQNFFEKKTLLEGPEKAISFFKELILEDPKFTENCHYMFHGIGHGAYKKFDRNLEKAFALGSSTQVLMTVPTCGNGYYHGIIEEVVRGIHEDVTLAAKIKNICLPVLESDPKTAIDCYHGLGHAILIEELGEIDKSITVCDEITNDEKMRSMCHTGIFMEMLRNYKSESKVLAFAPCEYLKTDMQKAECFNQHSYLLDDFLNHKEQFIENMKICEATIKNTEERIICIRKEKF